MKYSYHVHSLFSDGKSSIADIVAYAKKLNLDVVGISDHYHLSLDGSLIDGDMPLDKLNDYVSEVLSYSSSIKPKVFLGLEADFVPETIKELEKVILKYPFDYIIGSVHLVKNNIILDRFNNFLLPNNVADLMKQYWILIKQMAQTKMFDIVGHLDLIKSIGMKDEVDLSKEIDEALEAIKYADMTVEVNTSGWYKPCQEQYPSLDLLKKCKKLDIPIIVTSDTHQKEHLIRDFDRAIKLLKEIGYSKQSYFIKRKRYIDSF